MTIPFGERLAAAIDARGPLCVGIDPHASLLAQWDLPDSPEGLARFTDAVVEALAGSVAVLKPQMAFYERHGSRGLAVLEEGVARARAAGALVLLDAKRGDIGSTMDAYAGYLRPGHPLAVDAMTVSPYLGPGSLQPAVDTAREHGAGLFVLARTSNPEASALQLVGEPSVAQRVVDAVSEWNDGATTGSFGLVVGATLRELDVHLSGFGGPVLAPGLGAQGGSPEDVRRLFGPDTTVVPSVSRDVLGAGPDVASLRAAADSWAHALA